MSEASSDRTLTVPNLVSFVRLLGVPVFWWVLMVAENVALAAWLTFIIGWTDWIDGYLARKLSQESKLGQVLDPIADRLMIASAVIGGLIVDVLPPLIGFALIVREILMGGVALYLTARGAGPLEVRYLGKLATFLLYGAIPAFYLGAADFLRPFMLPLAWVTGVMGLALYWYVVIDYLRDARAMLSAVESPS